MIIKIFLFVISLVVSFKGLSKLPLVKGFIPLSLFHMCKKIKVCLCIAVFALVLELYLLQTIKKTTPQKDFHKPQTSELHFPVASDTMEPRPSPICLMAKDLLGRGTANRSALQPRVFALLSAFISKTLSPVST